MTTKKWVHGPSEVPSGEHWAIIEGDSVTIPGDERSRTCPGHGYSEHTERYVQYIAFTDKEEFKLEVTRRTLDKSYAAKSFRAIHVLPVDVEVDVKIA